MGVYGVSDCAKRDDPRGRALPRARRPHADPAPPPPQRPQRPQQPQPPQRHPRAAPGGDCGDILV